MNTVKVIFAIGLVIYVLLVVSFHKPKNKR